MLIIRAALTRPIEFGHAAIDHFIGQTPEPPVLNRLPSPFHVSATPLQLLSQQATHNDTALFQCYPFRNIKCGEFRIFREHLADKIRINDQAHPQPPIDRCVSIMKKLPVRFRRLDHIAQIVPLDAMNAHIQAIAFEIEQRNVIRFEIDFAIADVHPHSVNDVVAVRLHNQLATRSCHVAEQCSQRSLSAWMEMRLRLLQQELASIRIRPQQLREHGQYLADPVPDIDQISERPFPPPHVLANLDLERIAKSRPQTPHIDLIEQTCRTPEAFQRRLEAPPLVFVAPGQIGKVGGNAIALRRFRGRSDHTYAAAVNGFGPLANRSHLFNGFDGSPERFRLDRILARHLFGRLLSTYVVPAETPARQLGRIAVLASDKCRIELEPAGCGGIVARRRQRRFEAKRKRLRCAAAAP